MRKDLFKKICACVVIVILSAFVLAGCKTEGKKQDSNEEEVQSSESTITPNNLPNQKTYKVYSAKEAPTIDGTVSEGEYGDAIVTYNYNDGFTSKGDLLEEAEMKYYVSQDWNLYITYDENYVYFAITYTDWDFDTTADTAGYGVWNGDSIEIDLWKYADNWEDYNKDNKIRYICGMAKDDTYWGGWAAVADYTSPDAVVRAEQNGGKDNYAVSRNQGLYTYEVCLTWEEAIGTSEPVEHMFFYAQLATDSTRFLVDKPGAQFWWRNIVPFTEEEQKQVNEASETEGQYSYAPPILEFVRGE